MSISIVLSARRVPQTTGFSHYTRAHVRTFASGANDRKTSSFGLNTRRPSPTGVHDSLDHSDPGKGKFLRMLMFGKPGAGKGTLSSRLVQKYDLVSVSTGDLLRSHIQEKTEIGRRAEEIVKNGGLVPDDIMLEIVSSKLAQLGNKHWILDGFPRTLAQGQLLDSHLQCQNQPLTLVVNLDVPDEVILSRISDRWVHLPSGRVYNLSFNRPKVDGFDDVTGEPLTKRPDDNPEVFARRLNQFYASTAPLLQYYSESKAPLASLQGRTSNEIWPRLETVVRQAFPTLRERIETDRDERRRHSLSEAVFTLPVGAARARVYMGRRSN